MFFQYLREGKVIRSAGSALISALFIMAIAAIIATALLTEDRLLIYNSALVINTDQDYLTLQGMQLLAKNVVKQYASQWMTAQHQPPQYLAPLQTELPSSTINGMRLTGVIEDESRKFNVNALAISSNQAIFSALLQRVCASYNQKQRNTISQVITDYLTKHQALVTISELRLVKGITPAIFQAIKPYITALPMPLLSSNTTRYFLVKITGVKGRNSLTLNTLLITEVEKNNTLHVNIVWQEFM